jgi:hypothetical protein
VKEGWRRVFAGSTLPAVHFALEKEASMRRDGRYGARVARWAAVVIAGTFAGSILIGPAMAHLNRPLTFGHLKAHFYTKKLANSTFINVGEAASSATNATNAGNADKLDSLDSAAFQKSGCVNGNVMGYARIVPGFYGPSYETVPVSFTCVSGISVRAKQDPAGVFTVDFGFDGTPCGEHVPIATLEQKGDILPDSTSEGSDCVVVVQTLDPDTDLPVGLIFNLAVMRAAN